MFQKLQNFAKFQKMQLDNLVDFEKRCKTRIYLQRSGPIQPKTSEILPKFCHFLPGGLLRLPLHGLLHDVEDRAFAPARVRRDLRIFPTDYSFFLVARYRLYRRLS